MSLYAPPAANDNLVTLWLSLASRFEAVISLQSGSVEPSVKPNGALWHDTGASAIKLSDGTTFDTLIDLSQGVSKVLTANGATPLAGPLNCGGQQVQFVGAATLGSHAPRRDQVVLLTGEQPMSGNLDLGGNRATNAAPGVDASDLATVSQLGVASGSETISDAQDTVAYTIDTGVEFRALVVTVEWRNVPSPGSGPGPELGVLSPTSPAISLSGGNVAVDPAGGGATEFTVTPASTAVDPNDVIVQWVALS
ncbi:MAG: hypothetical protein AAGI53_01720 [Planctomycetota bacterium]